MISVEEPSYEDISKFVEDNKDEKIDMDLLKLAYKVKMNLYITEMKTKIN